MKISAIKINPTILNINKGGKMIQETETQKQEYNAILDTIGDFEPLHSDLIHNIDSDYISVVRCKNLVEHYSHSHRQNKANREDILIGRLHSGNKIILGVGC